MTMRRRKPAALHHQPNVILLLLVILGLMFPSCVESFHLPSSSSLGRTRAPFLFPPPPTNNINKKKAAAPTRLLRSSSTTTTSPTTLFLSYNKLLLPACNSPGQGFQVAALAGLTAALSQWLLSRWFFFLHQESSSNSFLLSKFKKVGFFNKELPSRNQKTNNQETADYTAHSVVALGLMILLSTVGILGWVTASPPPSSVSSYYITSRLLLLDISPTGRWMAAVVLGTFGLWDIPTSLRVNALAKRTDVLWHHLAMMVLGCLCMITLPMPYILFYFGVAELSSIPVILYDQVTYWLDNNSNNNNDKQQKTLEETQERLGIVAAISFTLVRVVWFTKVTFLNFLPDCWKALAATKKITSISITDAPSAAVLLFIMLGSIGFTLLQWFWFVQNIVLRPTTTQTTTTAATRNNDHLLID